jgi:hypothetical protein
VEDVERTGCDEPDQITQLRRNAVVGDGININYRWKLALGDGGSSYGDGPVCVIRAWWIMSHANTTATYMIGSKSECDKAKGLG